MTEIQYQRWKNFAMRMAWRGFPGVPRKSKLHLSTMVKDFFRLLENNYLEGTDKPVEAKFDSLMGCVMKWGEESEFLLNRFQSWDDTDSHPTWRDRYGHSSNGPYICDIVSEWIDNWAEGNTYDEDYVYRCWDNLWGSRIRCCLRAGLDSACEPSMGVLGFTAGDLRRMYRGNVPNWVMGTEPLELQSFVGVVPGVGLVPGERTLTGVFADIPDTAGLWL